MKNTIEFIRHALLKDDTGSIQGVDACDLH